MPTSLPHRPDRDVGLQSVEWIPVTAVIDANGDKVVTLHDDRGRPRTTRLAEIVLEAFVGPCPPGHELRFKDGDRRNCSLDNLEWAGAISAGKISTVGPATARPVRIDDDGRVLTENGEPIVIPGLDRARVSGGLSDMKAGRVRNLREILSEREG